MQLKKNVTILERIETVLPKIGDNATTYRIDFLSSSSAIKSIVNQIILIFLTIYYTLQSISGILMKSVLTFCLVCCLGFHRNTRSRFLSDIYTIDPLKLG